MKEGGMAAALAAERLEAPIIPLPRSRFEAMVVASSPIRRAALVSSLRSLGARDIVEAGSVAEARARSRQDMSRDVAVIDGSLHDGTALALIADLRAAGWRRAVLLSPRDDSVAVRGAMASGVRSYVVMPEEDDLDSRVTAFPRSRIRLGRADDLSAREVEVLQLVAEGQSNKDIGVALGLSALTVKSHLARISRKLGTGDRAEMVAISMRTGYVH
jgi:DNA-binding NarL/FixJ family response regulator